MAQRIIQTVPPAVRGLDTTSNPGTIEEGLAPVLRNFLVHREGLLPMRGPIKESSSLAVGTNELIAGLWVFNDKVLVSRWAKDATAKQQPWTTPFRKASASGNLARASTTMKLVDLIANTVTDMSSAASSADIIGGRGARLGAYVYGYAADVNTGTNPAVNEQGGNLFRRRLLRWDGSTTLPTVYANAPEGGQDVIAHLNRLWVLGGRDVPGGAPGLIEFNSLYWSDLFGPTADTTAMWKADAVPNAVNKIVVDSDNPNDFGVGLSVQGQNLMIFKRRSVHIMYGTSPQNFTVRPLSREVGCVDRRSIVELAGTTYWLSDQGVYSWDGETLRGHELDAQVKETLIPAVHNTVGLAGQDGGHAVGIQLPNDYIMWSVANQNTTTGVVADAFQLCYLYHAPLRRFVEFTTDAFDAQVPVDLARTSNYHFYTDGSWAARMNTITEPSMALEADRGSDYLAAAIPARTNLTTNPKFATDLTGWTANRPSAIKDDAGTTPPEDPTGKELAEGATLNQALAGTTDDLGNTWSTSGSGTVFKRTGDAGGLVDTDYYHTVYRYSDAYPNLGTTRIATINPSDLESKQAIAADLLHRGNTGEINDFKRGLVVRYVDSNNYLRGYIWGFEFAGALFWQLRVDKVVAGTVTNLYASASSNYYSGTFANPLRLEAVGTTWKLYWFDGTPVSGTDAVLGTTLAGGSVGLYSYIATDGINEGDIVAHWDNIYAWDPEIPLQKDLTTDGTNDFIANTTSVTTGTKLASGASIQDDIAVTNGTTYTVSAYFRAKVGTCTAQIDLTDWGGGTTTQAITVGGGWTRVSCTGTATSTATKHYTLKNTSTESANYLYVSAVCAETGAALYPYVEGSVSATSDRQARIPAAWWTRLVPGLHPDEMIQAHRFFLDYVFQVDDQSDAGAGDGWFVSIVEGTGRTLTFDDDSTEVRAPAGGDPSAYLYRRSLVRDVFSEANDCQIRIEWKDEGSGTYPDLVKAELYEVALEYTRSRQRRSS